MPQLGFHLVEATDSLARLQLLAGGEPLSHGAMLSGSLTGPRCRYARTLPSTLPIRNSNGTAEVLITEPCYWTADLPNLYDFRIQYRTGKEEVTGLEQPIGLRRLSTGGPSIFIENKRFVFRAARLLTGEPIDWQSWRDARLAIHVVDPSSELCHTASEVGVWIIAESSNPTTIDHLANCPAVAVIVPNLNPKTFSRLPSGPLIGARWRAGGAIETDADILLHEVRDIAKTKIELACCTRPVIALRPAPHVASLAEARTACEQLQRELAPELNLAGYIV